MPNLHVCRQLSVHQYTCNIHPSTIIYTYTEDLFASNISTRLSELFFASRSFCIFYRFPQSPVLVIIVIMILDSPFFLFSLLLLLLLFIYELSSLGQFWGSLDFLAFLCAFLALLSLEGLLKSRPEHIHRLVQDFESPIGHCHIGSTLQ